MDETLIPTIEEFVSACINCGGTAFGRELICRNGTQSPVLLVSHDFSLTGAPMALEQYALHLRKTGMQPVFISSVDGGLRESLCRKGFPVLTVPASQLIPLIVQGAGLFELIVINTIVGGAVVSALNGASVPVLWWIHEAELMYSPMMLQNMPEILHENVSVAAIGPRGKQTLLRCRPKYEVKELLYFLPDMTQETDEESRFPLSCKAKDKTVFSLVGTIDENKGQDIMADAIRILPLDILRRCFFVFVGSVNRKEIFDRIQTALDEFPDNVQYIPQIEREKMPSFYRSIDCLICPSRDDTMPMVVTEAFQFSKYVICSANTGSAIYAKQNNAAIVLKNNSAEELAEAIAQVVQKPQSELLALARRGRMIYERYFTEESFARQVSAIQPPSMNKRPDWSRQAEYYERIISLTAQAQKSSLQQYSKALEDKERHIQNQTAMLETAQSEKQQLDAQLAQRDSLIAQQRDHIAVLQWQYDDLTHAFFWKATKPLRRALDILKQNRCIALLDKGVHSLKRVGFSCTWQKVKNKLRRRKTYAALAATPLYTPEELDAQRSVKFEQDVTFSILVPLFNTPENFLHEMLRSVLDQTYAKWELCLADGSDDAHSEVEKICREYARSDKRIKYRKLNKNLGISGNTNACIDMATGEYIGLFDHDDLLHPAALYEVMRAICEKGADFIYTDEATFESPYVNKIITAHFKPDYAPDNLRANNYICHFSVFQTSLLQKAGVFRSKYDGSQDHDLVLRLTDAARCVVHIPKILYYWRSHPRSVAQDISSKPYAILAGINAVRDSLETKGIYAEVESSKAFPAIYRLKYRIIDCPQIDIIILARGCVDKLKRCVDSITKRSTYTNYHIIIVKNNSAPQELLAYLAELRDDERVTVLHYEKEFNCSAVNNWAAQYAKGQYYLFLNDDVEVITENWMEELLMYTQRSDVAATGAMLYYPDNTIYHAGVVLGMGQYGSAGYTFQNCRRGEIGYMGRLCYAQNMSAVKADCMLVKAEVFRRVCGFDETFSAAYNDVDLCMRIRRAGYLIAWTPYAELYYYESPIKDTPEKRKDLEGETRCFRERWAKELAAGDPYYNPNFSLSRADFLPRDFCERG